MREYITRKGNEHMQYNKKAETILRKYNDVHLST